MGQTQGMLALGERPGVILTYHGVDVMYDDDRLVNLNDMWKANGSPANKDPRRWKDTEQGRDFIANLARTLNVAGNDIWKSKRGGHLGGTWAHGQVALAYAKYLSPDFHILVNEAFRQWVEELQDPGLKMDRAIDGYRRLGMPDDWIERRLRGKNRRKTLTCTMQARGAVQRTYVEVTEIGNVKVVGKPARAIREERQPKTKQTRDSFTMEELSRTEFYESQTNRALIEGKAYGHGEIVDTAIVVGNIVGRAIEDITQHTRQARIRRGQGEDHGAGVGTREAGNEIT